MCKTGQTELVSQINSIAKEQISSYRPAVKQWRRHLKLLQYPKSIVYTLTSKFKASGEDQRKVLGMVVNEICTPSSLTVLDRTIKAIHRPWQKLSLPYTQLIFPRGHYLVQGECSENDN